MHGSVGTFGKENVMLLCSRKNIVLTNACTFGEDDIFCYGRETLLALFMKIIFSGLATYVSTFVSSLSIILFMLYLQRVLFSRIILFTSAFVNCTSVLCIYEIYFMYEYMNISLQYTAGYVLLCNVHC